MENTGKKCRWAVKALLALVWLVVAGVVCYAALIGLVYYWEVNVPEPTDYDSIIVLGAQVLPSGEPSVQLRWRLDKAKEYYEKHPCYMVVTGGQGSPCRPEWNYWLKNHMREALAWVKYWGVKYLGLKL